MRLLQRSNPTLFEWANSPIVYKTTRAWVALLPEINRHFSSKAGMYHYLNMAEKNYRAYCKGDLVRAKKYLYVLRPILACKWVWEHHSPPPILFSDLVAAELEPEMSPAIEELLKMKKASGEAGMIPKMVAIHKYIDRNLEALRTQAGAFSEPAPNTTDELNRLFRQIVLSNA